jgi:hypothetical protein
MAADSDIHPWSGLPALLRCLDECLAVAADNAVVRYGIGLGADPYRGLYVGDEQVQRLLQTRLDVPGLGPGRAMWPGLADAQDMDSFDVAVIVLALAPELDLKYERLYGYLQDDVTRKRPTVALALDLFCSSLEDRTAGRDHFAPDAPLRRERHVILDGDAAIPLLARPLRLDPQVVRHLLGGTGLDERLADSCQVLDPAEIDVPVPLAESARKRLQRVAASAREGRSARVLLRGPDLPMLRDLALEIAATSELRLLRSSSIDDPQLLRVLLAESRLLGYGVQLEVSGDRSVRRLLDAADREGGPLVIITTDGPGDGGEGGGFELIDIGRPGTLVRREWWERFAPAEDDADLDRLAARYRLTGSQIECAARAARAAASGAGRAPAVDDYALSARRQAANGLDGLASRVPIMATWDDLVLPAPATAALHELCDWVTHRETVLHQWGMKRRTNGRLGVNALFAGASGTGKTTAAQVIAGELGLDLFAIDLSRVVSKYIGETEKNLDAIFTAAQHTDAVLLFDEADALFGKRSEVRDSHDRYANLEVSYLLQRMEAHDGVAILATNLRQNLDEAFLRRLAFTIRFPFPEEAQRRLIWAHVWPQNVPLADDIDLDLLAERYQFSGGNIRNVAVSAAILAAARHRPVTLVDVLDAVEREYDKLGGGASSGARALRLAEKR